MELPVELEGCTDVGLVAEVTRVLAVGPEHLLP